MGSQPNNAVFSDSCVPINKVDCAVGTLLINPCSCQSYYWCIGHFDVINQTCSPRLFYDHTHSRCDRERTVEFSGICVPNKPWEQCNNQTDANLVELAQRCGGIHIPPPTTTTPTPGVQASDNTGLIVGVIVASVLLVIVLGILIFYWYRRQKTPIQREDKERSVHVNNPDYFSKPERVDSVYARMDDNMNNPVYNTSASTRPPLPNPPSEIGEIGPQPDENPDDEYAEPSDNGTILRMPRTSETLDPHGSVYAEVLEPDTPIAQTPYDNSWKS